MTGGTGLSRVLRTLALLSFFALGPVFVPVSFSAEEQAFRRIQAFQPGETLTYDISWSNIVTAGTATMEVDKETTPDGREVLKFIVKGRSTGVVDAFYPVDDAVQSVFDPLIMQSLTYSIKENYGRKKRSRILVFNHTENTVVSTLNNGLPETLSIPDQVQDGLSSLYYLRTREDFTIGKPLTIEVYDGGKIWSVEVSLLGREKVKTDFGEFATIKLRTYPRYKGVFMNKGEVFIWLTDDSRKVPVLMKSTLTVGSFVFTLVKMKSGDGTH